MKLDPATLRLDREQAVLLLIDMQERLAAAMPADLLERARRSVLSLCAGMRHLQVPVLVTEQYPRGLGKTLPDLLLALPEDARPIEKVEFSCFAAPAAREAIAALAKQGRRQVIACGMEAHVCVYQTARDLQAAGLQVFVPYDAVASRHPDNLRIGLSLIERAGGVITTTETVLFDLLCRAGTPEFRAVSALIK